MKKRNIAKALIITLCLTCILSTVVLAKTSTSYVSNYSVQYMDPFPEEPCLPH